MRVHVIKSEHLLQGMVVAEDVYTEAHQMILAHGMVLTPNLIYRLRDNSVSKVKIRSDYMSRDEAQNDETRISGRVEQSEEFRRFEKAYHAFTGEFETYIFRGLHEDAFDETERLTSGIREICQYASENVHLPEMILNLEKKGHLWTVHSINVALLAYICVKKMAVSHEEEDLMILAGLLHDIGRVVTPDLRIHRPGKQAFDKLLKSQEVSHMMGDHIRYGYELLNSYGFDKRICESALYHHEGMDGSGYLQKEQQHTPDLITRMTAIADWLDQVVIANFETVRKNLLLAIEVLEQLGAERFDRKLLRFCVRQIAEMYLHHVVTLSNGIRGEVVAINKNELTRPIVKTDYGYIDLGRTRQLEIARLY